MVWSMVAATRALVNAGEVTLAARYSAYIDMLARHVVCVFYAVR